MQIAIQVRLVVSIVPLADLISEVLVKRSYLSLSSLENIVRIPIVEKVQLKTLTISSLISKKIKTQVNLNNIGFIRFLLIIINILHSIKLKQKTVIILIS